MRPGTTNPPLVRGHLLPQSSLAASVAQRALHVTDLLLTRRRIAQAYRRAPSEIQLMTLKKIDAELAKHNINNHRDDDERRLFISGCENSDHRGTIARTSASGVQSRLEATTGLQGLSVRCRDPPGSPGR